VGSNGEEAIVTSVADGDSFRARMAGEEVEIRLLGVNAPERDECLGGEAADWLAGQIEGRVVSLVVADTDQFGRLLARVFSSDTDINQALVSGGYAVVLSEAADDRPELLGAEEAARASGAGIWGKEICGAIGPVVSVEIVDIDYDPPGADEVEVVEIENTGGGVVDLSGFVLRDESSVNRFELPVTNLGPGDRLDIEISGCDSPPSPGALAWCADGAVWNNDGDTALLLDRSGRIVSMLRY
jgi:hypothetical protein